MRVEKKRIVSLLLAVLLMWQIIPVQVLAGEVASPGTSLTEYLKEGIRGGEAVYHTVHFKKYDGEHLTTVGNVLDGTRLNSIAPTPPEREGYTFVQWTPPETYITGDVPTVFTFTAQYRSTNLYELNIKYVYENGSPAALSYLATLAYGEDYSVDSPEIVGFYVDPASDETISGEAGTSQNGAIELNYTVTYKASTGTPYTVEHYQQNINNDEYTKIGTETEVFYATTGSTVTVSSKNFPGFTAKTPTQQAIIAPDGSTVVKMYYDRISYILTFDTAGGNFIPPFQGRYGATVPAVANPTRTGYTFAGWSAPIPTTLTQSQTITASWTALGNVKYTLVYWLENADPIPGTSTYDYSYDRAVTRTGTAGTVYTIAAADKLKIEHFDYSHYDEGIAIAGDGSTVINIYYTRISYTVEFNLRWAGATLTIGGNTYTDKKPYYSFTAKYQSDISALWPTVEHISPPGSYEFTGWYITATGTTWVTKQTRLTDELLPPNPNATRTFRADWSLIVYPYDLNYMLESLDGTGEYYDGDGYGRHYKRDAALSGVVYSGAYSSWTAKPIQGMTSVAVVRDLNAWGFGGTVYLYYKRNTYTLDFQSHGELLSNKTKELKYGASILPAYNFTPDTPADLPGYSFGGWYTTSACTPGTEFNWTDATMPAQDLRLFAKWVPPTYYVYFNYTKPDGTIVQYGIQQVVQGQKAVCPDDPAAIPGYDFDGWYYAGTTTKYVFDAQVFSSLTLTGRYLPRNDRSYTVRYLFAADNSQAASPKTVTGQIMGATVTEQAASVPNRLPDALSKTLTLAADNNVITFYYSASNVDYTVRYLERDTGTELLSPATKSSGGQAVVTETAPPITNKPYQLPDNSWVIVDFAPDMPQKSLTLTSNPELNVITFYYEHVIKNHYEVRYLEKDSDAVLADPKHVITAKSEVVELPKTIANYSPHSVVSTYPDWVRGSSANYISTVLGVSDPVNQSPQVITFYYTPEHVDITGTKIWVDQGIAAPDQRPASLSITLYANGTELSPQPTYTWDKTTEENIWTYTYINLPAAQGGTPLNYTVRETVPENYVVSYSDKRNNYSGTDITNTLDGGTTTFSGTKTWVDTPDPVSGYNPRPDTLELTFYRKGHNDADWVEMTPQPSYSWDKTTGDNTWTYTATGFKKYEDGHLVAYKAEETLPLGYKQTLNDGQHFKNEVIYTTATKAWVDGPATRPNVWLRVYRQVGTGTLEPVPNAVWKAIRTDVDQDTVDWRGLAQTDENGNPYTFSVKEVNVQGNPFTPPNYTKVEKSLTVTNTYVIPTDGKATGTKTWVNGAATHPDLWLQLWRKTTTGSPLVDEAVPGADIIKVSETGNTSHEWTGLETTNIKGNTYTFYIKEGQWDGTTFTEGIPENYTRTGTGTLNLTNTYVIPTNGTFEATKVWVNGTQVAKPDIWFQLQRRVANGAWAPVTDAGVKPLQVTADNSYTVTWNDLEETDSAAQSYEFSVVEGSYDGSTFTPGSPSPFDTTKGEYTNKITNTYVSPKREDIIVTKAFETTCPKNVAPVTPVTLELWRKAGTADAKKVGEVILDGNVDAVEFYPWKAKFTNLDATDENGNPYTYWADESVVPGNYVKKDIDIVNAPFTVTNTWQGIPFTAKKEWAGGYKGMERPPVSFQLQRKTEDMATPEDVGNPVTLDGIPDGGSLGSGSGEHTAWTYTWESLPKHDNNNEPYTYTFTETGVLGYNQSEVTLDANGLGGSITNTFEGVSVNATKRIVIPKRYSGTTVNPPPFTFTLSRSVGEKTEVVNSVILNGVVDTQGGAENDALKPDGSGETAPSSVGTDANGNTVYQWHYTWQNLPKNDEKGVAYAYTVSEPYAPPQYVRMSETVETIDGIERFVITNEYNDSTFRAKKEWNTKTGTPSVTFGLQRAKITDPNPDNWIWTDMTDLDIVLDGIADDPNGTARYEDIPWRAVWKGLPAQVDGVLVKYRVQEDSIANYEVDTATSASTVITNTSLKADITAKKVWVGGETVRPDQITLTLSRYYEGGTTEDTGYQPPAAATLTKPEDNNNDWGTHTWENQERFYTDQGVQKEYVYKVTESYKALAADKGSFTSECEVAADGVLHTITNTYTPPTRDYYMKKAWDGGKPRAVTVQLQRKYEDEGDNAYTPMGPGHTLDGVEDTAYGEFSNAKELENWVLHRPSLIRADNTGRAYQYRIVELTDLSNYGFTSYSVDYDGTEYDAVVTNHYEIPTDGEATVKKVWLNGPAEKPDVYFQLWRKTTTGTDDVRQQVPNLDPIKINNHVGYEYTFTDLAKTDKYANPYTFYAKEGQWDGTTFTEGTPANYKLVTEDDSLTLTNEYVIPTTGTETATKIWVNGPAAKPEVWFQLHRKTGTGSWEIVPGAEIKQVPVAPAELKVEWSDLEATDINGNAYEFGVVEGSYKNNTFTAGAPENYTTTAQPSLAITNTYVSPKREDITVSKVFKISCDGIILDDENIVVPVTPVTLKLMRQVGTAVAEEVGEVELDGNIGGLEHGAWKAKFTDLDATDKDGNSYTYTVEEPVVPSNYVAAYDPENFIVTNTWQGRSFTAKKEWAGGYNGMKRPQVTFQLQRKTEDMATPENVGSPVLLDGEPDGGIPGTGSGEHEAWTYTWRSLPEKDSNNKPYTYTVTETPLIGYTPTKQEVVNGVYTIVNTYEHVDIDAQKIIEFPNGIPANETVPYFEFVLRRNDGWEETVKLDGVADGVLEHQSGEREPAPPEQNKLTWNYSWKYLPQKDAKGNDFIYTLNEPNPPKGYVRKSVSGDMTTKKFIVTNEHRADVFRAFKYWDTKTGTVPVTFRLEWSKVDEYGNPYDGWNNASKDVELNGIIDSDENSPPNDTDYYEDSPWRAVWTNLPTQVGGVTVKYRVQEEAMTPAGDYDTVTSASTAIENISLKTDITAAVVWVNGETIRPDTVTLKLNRYKQVDNELVIDSGYTEKTAILNKPALNNDNWELYTWVDEERFYTDQGEQKEYVYKVTELYTLAPNTGSFSSECKTTQDGVTHTITNTYVPPLITLNAAKVWDGGDASERPEVTFHLWRRISGGDWALARANTPGHTLDGVIDEGPDPLSGAEEYAPWKMRRKDLPLRDIHGNLYEYKITETATVPGFLPPDYKNDQTIGEEPVNFVVTNKYIIPTTGVAVVKKVFEQGENAAKPNVWFQLWRKTMGGAADNGEAVPNVAPVNITAELNYTYTFDNLETTDSNAKPYTFYVKEGNYNENTKIFTDATVFGDFSYSTGEGTLTLINRYASPTTATASATKKWVGGPFINQTGIDLTLYRKTATGTDEPVPQSDLGAFEKSGTAPTFAYSWTGLKNTDPQGNPYTYYVREPNVTDGKISVGEGDSKTDYAVVHVDDAANNATTITNTYVSPTLVPLTVGKDWSFPQGVDGDLYKTEVTLSLMRSPEGSTASPEKVQDIVLDGIVGGHEEEPWRGTIEGLPERNQDGVKYIYSVVEDDVPGNYVMTIDAEDPFTVINTWQTTSFTAKKKWSAPSYVEEYPEITFQLQRSIDGLTFEQVGDSVTISDEPWTYTWTNLPKYSPTKELYTYTFTETRVAGYTPSDPVVDEEDNIPTITNTFEGVSVKATKRIVIPKRYGTAVIPPSVSLTLYRNGEEVNSVILNGVADTSGGTGNDALKPDGSGETAPDLVGTDENGNTIHQWHYTWNNLPKKDEKGADYKYTVGEPVVPPLYVRTGVTGDAGSGFVITNEYNDGTFRATKNWDTKTGTVPVTFQLEYATVDDPEKWQDMPLKSIGLNGIADSEENNPNNPDYYEYSPWSAVWTGLPTQIGGKRVKYRVQETAPDGYDAVSSASTVITNISQNTDITAAVEWVNGENVRPQSVTLILNRYLKDGTTPAPGYIPLEKTLNEPTGNGDNWGTHTWKDQPRYYGTGVDRQEYIYKVSEKQFALGPNEGSFAKTEFAVIVDGVHTITNTYEQPFVNLKAAKVWDGGDASDRPAVTIRLWRRYKAEPGQPENEWKFANLNAPGHTLDGEEDADYHTLTKAREYDPWKMEGDAPLRDKQGNLFEYKITETATVPGFKDPVYSFDQTIGDETIPFVVTNKYIIPTGEVTATKIFDQGENADKPEIWFQLWRKTTTGSPLVDEVVSDIDPVKITDPQNINAQGHYTHTFSGLKLTDKDANIYTYYVVEGTKQEDTFTPATKIGNFSHSSGQGTLTLTNRYVIPTTGTATATKKWVNGPAAKPEVWFQLYRKTGTGSWEVVPGADIKKVPTYNSATPDTVLSVSWNNLEMTDINGNKYEFGVVEGVYDEATDYFTPGAPMDYTVKGQLSRVITNTYDPPADATFTATKTWSGGPNENKTPVTLDLYRKSKNMTEREQVTGVTPQITGQAPTYTYTWDNLISRDSNGDLYTFTVKEQRDGDEEGYLTLTAQDGSKYKYKVSYGVDDITGIPKITNTYQIPEDKDVTATKAWVKGSSNNRPDVWFKLQRRISGNDWKDVPGAVIKQVPAQDPQKPDAALSVTWKDQERTDFDGNAYEFAVVEGTLYNDVFTEETPANYMFSGQGTLNLTNTYTIPTDTVIAKKQWVNGPANKPTVWFKLQRAVDDGEPADITAEEAGSDILKLLPGALSVKWDNVEQTDINGKPYTFSIVEGLLNEDTQEFTPGLPDSYEYTTTPMTDKLGVINTYTSPTGTKTTKKIWAGGGPTPYPDVWLRLERATNPGEGFEAVPDADPTKVSMLEGSAESEPITWENVALKDKRGMPYVFRVREGVYDENSKTFTQKTPANYVSDSGQYDMGQGLQQVTNTWQTFDLTAEIIWDGAPAAAYDLPDDKTATLSLYRYTGEDPTQKEKLGTILLDGITYKVTTALKYVGRATAEGWKVKVSALPKYNLDTGELYTYLVEQSEVLPLIYTAKPPVQTGGDWVFTNTFDKTTVEVFKKYEGTTVRPPVTIVLFQNGVEFDRFELDGIPHGSADSGEPYEKQEGLLIWPNLPTRTLPIPAEGANPPVPSKPAVYTVTELIPENHPYQRIITGNATDGFLITNTYNEGRFTAIKRWNIGQAPVPERVTFKLWRWVSGSGYHEKEEMPEEYDGFMDGTVDAVPSAHGSESRPWEYTWLNLPLNGNHNNDPTQPVYYTYFVKEVPLGSDYIVDAVTSSSVQITNIALKTQFTAQKIWGGGPEPDVYFQLMQFDGTETISLGNPVLLNGEADAVSAGESGELSPWIYTWTNLPRFVDNDPTKLYTYTAREVNAAGEDFTPEGYDRYGNDSSRIINIHNSDVSAVKTWVGGDAQRAAGTGPETYFTLYRRTIFEEAGDALVVPADELGKQSVTKLVTLRGPDDSPNTVTVTWEKLPWGTGEGLPYIYSVVETDSKGNPQNVWKDADNPQTYIYNTTYDENDPLKATDTYESPTRGVKANKFWHGVTQGDTLPGIWLKLWRGLTADDQALVPAEEAEAKAIPGASFAGQSSQVSWTGVPKFDAQGREHVYTTREYAAADATEPGAAEGFANIQEGLDQHNIKLMDIKATKHWVQLPENTSHPEVVLQLKRAEAGSTEPAQVVDAYTVLAGIETSTQHIFAGKPIYGRNAAGEMVAYTYMVDEAAVPNGYTKSQDGNTITNTYDGVTNQTTPADPSNPQEPVTFRATKQWAALPAGANGAAVLLQLQQNGAAYGDAIQVSDDGTHVVAYEWTNLPKYAPDGTEYVYTVDEASVPNGYTKTQDGNTITNTYDGVTNQTTPADPSNPQEPVIFTATKKWTALPAGANGAAVLLQLQQNGAAYGDAVQVSDDGTHAATYEWTNLPKYAPDGTEYTYSVDELVVPDGYTKSQVGNTITNTYDGVTNQTTPADPSNPQEPVIFTATKQWVALLVGANGAAASLQLQQNGAAYGDTVQVTDDGTHVVAHEWTNLLKYAPDGTEYTYSVEEPAVPNGYTKSQDGNTITNTYDGVTNQTTPADPSNRQEPVTFRATKQWVALPAGANGANVSLQLQQNGTAYGDAVQVSDDGMHVVAYEWTNLPKYAPDGTEYVYTAEEPAVPDGYTKSQDGNTITNTYDGVTNHTTPADPSNPQEPVTFRATKQWAGLPAGANGVTVSLQLQQNGAAYGDVVQVTDDGMHIVAHEWTNLPKYAPDGMEYVYTVEEPTVPNGYTKTQNSNTITNTYDGVTNQTTPADPSNPQELVIFTATKKWAGLPAGANGANVSLQLQQNGTAYGDAVQVSDDGMHVVAYEWTNLPKYAPDGTEYVYTAEEPAVPDGYTKSQDGNTITNTYDGVTNHTTPADPSNPQEPVTFRATKQWAGLPAGANGVTVSLQLQQNGAAYGDVVQVTDDGTHIVAHEWMNLPKYAPDATEYTYTVDEAAVPNGYTKTQDGNTITNTYDGVTNHDTPTDPGNPQEPVAFTATKHWAKLSAGANGAAVMLQLRQNGAAYGNAVQVTDNGTHTAVHEWTNLPKYAPDASEYVYTVDEAAVPNGYTKTQDGHIITNTYDGVTNHDTPADPGNPQEPVTFTATKKWTALPAGANGAAVTLQLQQNGVAYGDVVQITDNGTHTAAHEWTNLPKYAPDATEYTYTVDEAAVPNGYTKTQDDHTITNTYDGVTNHDTPADPGNPQEPVTFKATKHWANLPENTNGAAVTLQLRQNGVVYGDAVQVTDNGTHTAAHEWTNLPKYAPDATEYAYTVDEPAVPNGYTKTQDGNTITNTYDGVTNQTTPADPSNPQEPVIFTATKQWVALPAGANGAAVSLQLHQNGAAYGDVVQVSDDGTHVVAHEWTNLPKYAPGGTEYVYTVDEVAVPNGYTKTQEGNTITNTYDGVTNNQNPDKPVAEPVTIHVAKVWQDADGNAIVDNSQLPASLAIKLTGSDGLQHDHTMAPNTKGAWEYTYTNLYKYDSAGMEITYSLSETEPLGYSQAGTATGDQTAGFVLTNRYDGADADGQLLDITVRKVWQDKEGNLITENLPESLNVSLTGGETDVEATLTPQNAWTHTFTGVKRYDTAGREFPFAVAEDTPNGYVLTSNVQSEDFVFTLTNTYDGITNNKEEAARQPVDLTIQKVWLDAEGKPLTWNLPSSLQVAVAGGQLETTLSLTAEDGWSAALRNVKKFDTDGILIAYEVTESIPNGYKLTGNVEGPGYTFTLTNQYDGVTNHTDPQNPAHPEEPVAFKVTKVWKNVPEEGDLPKAITLRLMANGLPLEERTLTRNDKWQTNWSDLYRYDTDGSVMDYQVAEVDVPQLYKSQVEGDAVKGYTVTNTYQGIQTPEIIPGVSILLSIGDYLE